MSDIRKTVYGMHKKAIIDGLVELANGGMKALTDLGSMGAVYLLAATGLTGIGTGWTLAKMTAKGKQDIDVAKKEYENERLRSDIGYLNTRLNAEYNSNNNKIAPKPARIITA